VLEDEAGIEPGFSFPLATLAGQGWQAVAGLLLAAHCRRATGAKDFLVRHGVSRDFGNQAPKTTSAKPLEFLEATLNQRPIQRREAGAFDSLNLSSD